VKAINPCPPPTGMDVAVGVKVGVEEAVGVGVNVAVLVAVVVGDRVGGGVGVGVHDTVTNVLPVGAPAPPILGAEVQPISTTIASISRIETRSALKCLFMLSTCGEGG